MTDPKSAVISSVITEVVVPELVAFIRRRHQETGQVPSDADIKAHVDAMADRIIAAGERFLEAHAAPSMHRSAAELGVYTGSTGD